MAITREIVFGAPHGIRPLFKDHKTYLTKAGDRTGITKLHEFKMGDVDDLEIYVAQPIYEWQQTDAGKWCTEHAEDMKWEWNADMSMFGYRIIIWGKLCPEDQTYFLLRWGTK